MTATLQQPPTARARAADMLRPAIAGGIVLGATDILFALLYWKNHGLTMAGVFQSIARGVYGKQAASLGSTSVAVGALCHFFIAICMVYAWLAFVARRPAFNRRWYAWGAVYGLVLYLFMNFVLLPITPVGWPKFSNPGWIAASVCMHVVFGIWCGYCGFRYSNR